MRGEFKEVTTFIGLCLGEWSWSVDLRQLEVKLYGQVIIDGNGLTGKDVLIKLIDRLLSKDFCCTPWLVKGQRSIFKLLSHFLLRESTEL